MSSWMRRFMTFALFLRSDSKTLSLFTCRMISRLVQSFTEGISKYSGSPKLPGRIVTHAYGWSHTVRRSQPIKDHYNSEHLCLSSSIQ